MGEKLTPRIKRLRRCPTRCGGGLTQGKNPFGRPQFTCGKCAYTFTCGKSGEPYASVVPMAAQALKDSSHG